MGSSISVEILWKDFSFFKNFWKLKKCAIGIFSKMTLTDSILRVFWRFKFSMKIKGLSSKTYSSLERNTLFYVILIISISKIEF